MLYLTDDGTLDTVFTCRTCGAEVRYTFQPCGCDTCVDPDGPDHDYRAFFQWAETDAESNHVCVGPQPAVLLGGDGLAGTD